MAGDKNSTGQVLDGQALVDKILEQYESMEKRALYAEVRVREN